MKCFQCRHAHLKLGYICFQGSQLSFRQGATVICSLCSSLLAAFCLWPARRSSCNLHVVSFKLSKQSMPDQLCTRHVFTVSSS